MRRAALFLVLASAGTGVAHADDTSLASIAALAEVNGQALACGPSDVMRRAKALMIAHAAKTAVVADVFDQGTRQAFLAQTRGSRPCPAAAALSARLDDIEKQMQGALASAQASDAGVAVPLQTEPRYLLEGPRGRAITAEDFRGRFQLVTFGYTSCPDVCPTTLLEMQQVLDALGARATAVQPIFITVDPRRDVAAVREAYARNFDARILALGGGDTLVRHAAAAFNVRYEKVQAPGAAPDVYTVDHTAGLFLVGPDGLLLERFTFGAPVADVVARIERWMAAAPGH